MSELRYDPVLEEWVATATYRMDRPQMPRDWCPFCPGSGKVPDSGYETLVYSNDFPTFRNPPYPVDVEGDELYRVKPSHGYCDVVLYHPDHNRVLAELPVEHIEKLVETWRNRYIEIFEDKKIKYTMIFENNGEAIGVTMPHPHGQIYAFPFLPPRVERRINSARKYSKKHESCLFCDILKREKREKSRIITKNKSFTAFVPFYAHWPFEMHVYANRHLGNLIEMKPVERRELADIIKTCLNTYNNLFESIDRFPYVMMLNQAPADGKDYSFYHFHLEFYPPYRSETKLKYLAGCELGGGTFINDSSAEQKAAELRAAHERYRHG